MYVKDIYHIPDSYVFHFIFLSMISLNLLKGWLPRSFSLFMKNVGQYVKTLYERPEIREVNPGHLVRSGGSTSYDVAFGKSVGGAAVKLLVNGTYGVTVAGVFGSDIHYMKTADAIKQRLVDLDEISLYEEMDICFGRRPVHFQPKFTEIVGKVWRHL